MSFTSNVLISGPFGFAFDSGAEVFVSGFFLKLSFVLLKVSLVLLYALFAAPFTPSVALPAAFFVASTAFFPVLNVPFAAFFAPSAALPPAERGGSAGFFWGVPP